MWCQAHPNPQPQPPILDSLSLEENGRCGESSAPLFSPKSPSLIAAIRPISLLAFHGELDVLHQPGGSIRGLLLDSIFPMIPATGKHTPPS